MLRKKTYLLMTLTVLLFTFTTGIAFAGTVTHKFENKTKVTVYDLHVKLNKKVTDVSPDPPGNNWGAPINPFEQTESPPPDTTETVFRDTDGSGLSGAGGASVKINFKSNEAGVKVLSYYWTDKDGKKIGNDILVASVDIDGSGQPAVTPDTVIANLGESIDWGSVSNYPGPVNVEVVFDHDNNPFGQAFNQSVLAGEPLLSPTITRSGTFKYTVNVYDANTLLLISELDPYIVVPPSTGVNLTLLAIMAIMSVAFGVTFMAILKTAKNSMS